MCTTPSLGSPTVKQVAAKVVFFVVANNTMLYINVHMLTCSIVNAVHGSKNLPTNAHAGHKLTTFKSDK